jgi:hypothetical protein
MAIENREANAVADQGRFCGIPIVLWQTTLQYVVPAAFAILGIYLGHEWGHDSGLIKGQTLGIERGKSEPPENQVNLNRMTGEIKKPSPGETVGDKNGEFECSGTVDAPPPDLHLWLAVERNGYIWPKADNFAPDKSGNWGKTISEQGNPNDPFTVTLLVANEEGHKAIMEWFRKGKETNNFAQLPWIRGINRIDRVDRLRSTPKP